MTVDGFIICTSTCFHPFQLSNVHLLFKTDQGIVCLVGCQFASESPRYHFDCAFVCGCKLVGWLLQTLVWVKYDFWDVARQSVRFSVPTILPRVPTLVFVQAWLLYPQCPFAKSGNSWSAGIWILGRQSILSQLCKANIPELFHLHPLWVGIAYLQVDMTIIP